MKKICFSIIFFLCLLMVSGFVLAGEVSNYNIEVALDVDSRLLSGTMDGMYYNQSDYNLSELYFVLPGNYLKERNEYVSSVFQHSGYPDGFDPGFTKIKKVATRNSETSFTYEEMPRTQKYSNEEALLKIELEEPLLPGETIALEIDFETKIPHRIGEPGYNRQNFIWRFGWFPLERPFIDGEWSSDSRQLAAEFEGVIEVPRDYTVAIGADSKKVEKAGQKNRCFLKIII